MDVKKILTDAYLKQWDFERRREELPATSEIYKIGLALDKIEPLFTIDRIQAYVDARILLSKHEEEIHEKQLKRLAQIYARTLFPIVLKYRDKPITIQIHKRAPASKRGTIKGEGKIARLRGGGFEIVTYSVYEYAIVRQRQTYASNTYPCYRPKQNDLVTTTETPVPA